MPSTFIRTRDIGAPGGRGEKVTLEPRSAERTRNELGHLTVGSGLGSEAEAEADADGDTSGPNSPTAYTPCDAVVTSCCGLRSRSLPGNGDCSTKWRLARVALSPVEAMYGLSLIQI